MRCRITIASPPDREKLVAEIFFGDCQWAELAQEGDEPQLEFYPRPDGNAWTMTLLEAEEALRDAKRRLFDATS